MVWVFRRPRSLQIKKQGEEEWRQLEDDEQLYIDEGDRLRVNYVDVKGNLEKEDDLGQCVTGDTLLAVAKTEGSELDNIEGSDLRRRSEPVEIKDVKGGEKVWSLDTDTGEMVARKIKGLMDMG